MGGGTSTRRTLHQSFIRNGVAFGKNGYDLSMEAILAAVQPYEIHGTPYYRIAYATKADPDKIVEGRVASIGLYRGAKPGDRVDIRMLLGVIDEVKKIEDGVA